MQAYEVGALVHELSDPQRVRQLMGPLLPEDWSLHQKLMEDHPLNDAELDDGVRWLNKLMGENRKRKPYREDVLRHFFQNRLAIELVRKDLRKNEPLPVSRTVVINALILKYGYTSYLEIGVNDPKANFDLIHCKQKTGVDPAPARKDIIGSTSNDYFDRLDQQTRYDIIFIDGLHQYEQVIADIANALNHLTEGGSIVCHDMLPESEPMQRVPRQTAIWTGDCWKAWVHYRMTDPSQHMQVIDADFGIGVMQKGKQELFTPATNVADTSFSFFRAHRSALMNVVASNIFLQSLRLSAVDIEALLHMMNAWPLFNARAASLLKQ